MLLLVTCAPSAPTTNQLQVTFGPSPIVRFRQQEVLADLNDDGECEMIRLLLNEARGLAFAPNLADLRDGLIIDGFALFSSQRSRIPVFYFYMDSGLSLRLRELEGRVLLVSEGGRDHAQRAWGWWAPVSDWPPPQWSAKWRGWDQERVAYGRWHGLCHISVSQGK